MATSVEASMKRTIRRHQLREMVPLADSTIYEMEQRGEFPRRFALSPRCVVWDLSEVEHGSPRADPLRSPVRSIPMSRNGDRARFGGQPFLQANLFQRLRNFGERKRAKMKMLRTLANRVGQIFGLGCGHDEDDFIGRLL